MLTPNQIKSDQEDNGKSNRTSLIKETISFFDRYRFPKDVKNYKQYFGFNIERLQHIEDWQANISYPIGASIINSTFANMADFWYEFGVMEKDIKHLMNKTFDYKSQWRLCLIDMIKEGLITGKGYAISSFHKEVKTITLAGKYEIEEVIKKPTIKYISKFNVFFDHNYSVEDSPYQIIRQLLSWDAIKKKYKALLTEEQLKKLETTLKEKSEITARETNSKSHNVSKTTSALFSSSDFNPVKDILSYQNSIMNSYHASKMKKSSWKSIWINDISQFFSSHTAFWGSDSQSEYNISEQNLFKYDDSKTYEVIEYEESGIVYLYINWIELTSFTLEKSGRGRIRWIEFNRIPGTSESLGIMDILWDLQYLLDSIWNWFIDNIKMQLTWMFKKRWNVEWHWSWNKMRFEKFWILTLKWDADIERMEMWLWDFMPLNMVQFLDWFMSKLIWVNDYHLGGQHKVERVADGIDFMRSQYKSKLAVMIDSIQRLMWDIARDWIVTYLSRYDEKELEQFGLKITKKKEENWKDCYYINDVKLNDVLSEDSVTFTYNALETIDMERDRERLMALFTPLAQNGTVDQDLLFQIWLGKNFKDIRDLYKDKEANLDGNTDMWKELSWNLTDKYNQEVVQQPEGDWAVQFQQAPMNSATTAKIPWWAKMRQITNELNSTWITNRLSI